MMRVYIEGIGLCGPGLGGWTASLPVLAGRQDHVPAPTRLPPDTLLPANERRRAGRTVRLALAVGTEAFATAGRNPAGTATVFASSGGDGETIHEILSVLASPDRELSPTRFHHSVHNTPAGYWGLATGSRAPSSSLCCHDDSFIAGMLEALVLATVERQPVAMISYDVGYPAPLSDVRPIGAAFAVAFVLSPTATEAALGRIDLRLQRRSGMDRAMPSESLEVLRQSTPAARSLPLLAALASDVEAAITISYLGEMAVAFEVSPIRPARRVASAAPERVAG
ncbi:MAG: beta-ketoacyl synthase chain length factor [Acetobacteraceae bacterium]